MIVPIILTTVKFSSLDITIVAIKTETSGSSRRSLHFFRQTVSSATRVYLSFAIASWGPKLRAVVVDSRWPVCRHSAMMVALWRYSSCRWVSIDGRNLHVTRHDRANRRARSGINCRTAHRQWIHIACIAIYLYVYRYACITAAFLVIPVRLSKYRRFRAST